MPFNSPLDRPSENANTVERLIPIADHDHRRRVGREPRPFDGAQGRLNVVLAAEILDEPIAQALGDGSSRRTRRPRQLHRRAVLHDDGDTRACATGRGERGIEKTGDGDGDREAAKHEPGHGRDLPLG